MSIWNYVIYPIKHQMMILTYIYSNMNYTIICKMQTQNDFEMDESLNHFALQLMIINS